jgi:hypothetical protein
VFLSKRALIDVHDEMDEHCYEMHFVGSLISNLPPKSVITMNNPSYINLKKRRLSLESWKTENMQPRHTKPHIPFEGGILKEDLMDMANCVRYIYGVHNIDAVDKRKRHTFI